MSRTIPEDLIGNSGHRALHEIRQEAVQLGARMARPRQATDLEDRRLHIKVSALFLHQYISSHLGGAEQRMLAMVNAHGFVDSQIIWMVFFNFPPLFFFDEW
jgi:hypothetical protein